MALLEMENILVKQNLDTVTGQCYRLKPFENYEERLEYLFGMREEMTVKKGEIDGKNI